MTTSTTGHGIAVVGMAGRFPGASDLDTFWHNLASGTESIVRLTRAELAAAGVDDETARDPAYVAACAALDGIDRFDAGFFGIGPREAELIDPQHRVFLECAFEALEAAGCDPARFEGPIGVFAGSTMSTYLTSNLLGHPAVQRWPGSFHTLLGNDKDYLALSTSYKLGLRGPSIGVQTACSTSLVAVHLACTSLLDRECDVALAGGVTIRVPHPAGYVFAEGGPFSPDGHCRPFDAAARGTVFGSGAGAVVLRRLEDALADGDPVVAVIRSSAVNNDGSLKVGFTAPSQDGQARAIAEALARADVDPRSIQYVEAHGTGMPLGDPIEVAALNQVFGAGAPGTCALGAVKGNIGHLEAAAGVTGLIKTILALHHRQIPPSLHFATPNPVIDFAAGPFFVNTTLRPWPAHDGPRRAGVSSFGMGGTNAHVVLEEAPRRPDRARAGASTARLIPLSARGPEALRALARSWRALLAREPAGDAGELDSLAATASLRRSHHDHRLAVVGADRAACVRALDAWLDADGAPVTRAPGTRPRLVFVFPGSGARWLGAGRELLAEEPVFATAIRAADAALARHGAGSVIDALAASAGTDELPVDVMQPCLFALEVALAALWRSWGVQPDAVVGHSLGEIAAAHVAGALSLKDAARIIVWRSRLLQRLNGRGAMTAIELPADDVPSHTPLVEPLRAELRARLCGVAARGGAIPVWSTVTGAVIPGERLGPEYWERNLREPVAFGPAIAGLVAAGHTVFVEVSPHPTLSPHVTSILRGASRDGAVLPSLRLGAGEHETLLESLGALYTRGVPVAWSALYASPQRCVPLPRYPWQRERCWVDPVEPGGIRPRS